jgi:hypothetical protein
MFALLLCVKRCQTERTAARVNDVLREHVSAFIDVTTEWHYSQSIIQASLSNLWLLQAPSLNTGLVFDCVHVTDDNDGKVYVFAEYDGVNKSKEACEKETCVFWKNRDRELDYRDEALQAIEENENFLKSINWQEQMKNRVEFEWVWMARPFKSTDLHELVIID